MQLKIKPVPDFLYSSGVHEFPVDIEISTESPTEIDSRVDVTGALLTRAGDSEATLGYVRRVFPFNRQIVAFSPQEPLRMRIDVFEQDEDFKDYLPGAYCCDIKVEVGEKVGDKICPVTLRGSLEVIVA